MKQKYESMNMNNSTWCYNKTHSTETNSNNDSVVIWNFEIAFPCTLFVFASIAGSVFNTLLVIAILGSKKLRTPPGVMIVVIAISELVLCLVFYPLHIATMIHGETAIPDSLCKMSAIVVQLSTFQTITSFPIVAFNRHTYVTRQRYVYNEMFNWKRTALYIFLSWLFPVVVIATPICFSKPDIRFSYVFRICNISTTIPIYVYVEWVYFLLFYAITMVYYGKVIVYIRSHVEDRRQRLPVTFATGSNRMGVQASKMIAVASFGYCVCCLPYLTLRVIDPSLTTLPALVHRIMYGIMAVGSFVNPVLFTLKNTSHILAIKAIIKLKSPDTFIPKIT